MFEFPAKNVLYESAQIGTIINSSVVRENWSPPKAEAEIISSEWSFGVQLRKLM